MLSLTRKKGQRILIPSLKVIIEVRHLSKDKCVLGITAPVTEAIYREEILPLDIPCLVEEPSDAEEVKDAARFFGKVTNNHE